MSFIGDLTIGSLQAAITVIRGPLAADQSVGQAAAATVTAARAWLKVRVVVTLSGGGVSGFVGCAFLKHTSSENLHFDAAAGVSSGAIVAGFHAWNPNSPSLGAPPAGIARLLALRRPMIGAMSPGICSLRPFKWWVESVTGATALSSTTIPAYLAHTRIPSGLPGIASTGTLGEAMTAAGTFPGMYAPVDYEGSAMSDGAFSQVLVQPRNLRALGYDFVFALNAFPRGLPITGRNWLVRTTFDTLVALCQPWRRTRDFQSSIQTMYARVADSDAGFVGQWPGALVGDERSCEYHWIADPREFESVEFDEMNELVEQASVFATIHLINANSPAKTYKNLVIWRVMTLIFGVPIPKPAPVVVYEGPCT